MFPISCFADARQLNLDVSSFYPWVHDIMRAMKTDAGRQQSQTSGNRRLRVVRHTKSDISVYGYLGWWSHHLSQAGLGTIDKSQNRYVRFVGRVFRKLGLNRSITRNPQQAYLMVIGWNSDSHTFPICYRNELIPYCLDMWPGGFDELAKIFMRHRVKTAFFSARDVARHFQQRMPGLQCYWAPEASEPRLYDPSRPLVERTTDVIEYGRGLARLDQVRSHLDADGKTCIWNRGTHWHFETNQQLHDALADSKISLSFPASVTNPERARGVETATLRYFEAIASKTIPYGHAPDELIDLFGFNPVIEMDEDDPAGQLLNILNNLGRYQLLVDKSHRRFLEVGCWSSRAVSMLLVLKRHGYAVPESGVTAVAVEETVFAIDGG